MDRMQGEGRGRGRWFRNGSLRRAVRRGMNSALGRRVLAGLRSPLLHWRTSAQSFLAGRPLQLQPTTQSLRQLHMRDPLTGLAAPGSFIETVQEACEIAERQSGRFAVAMLTLREIGTIQSTLGPYLAELLMLRLAARVRDTGAMDAGYFGEGRFAVLATEATDAESAAAFVAGLQAAWAEPVDLGLYQVSGELVAGISLYPRDGDTAETLVDHALVAMTRAYAGHHTLLNYEVDAAPDPVSSQLSQDLRNALAAGRLTWEFQPVYGLHSHAITGAEMLVCWEHAELGLIPPAHFLALAEQSGLMQQLGRQALQQALQVQRQWRRQQWRLHLNLNLAPSDLADAAFIQALLDAAREQDVWLTLDIAAAALDCSRDTPLHALQQLRQAGYRLALDGYGTTEFPLEWLRAAGFDELKLDRSLVVNSAESDEVAQFMRGAVQTARRLGAQVVAVGVEDPDTLNLLQTLGCRFVQGNVVSRPLDLQQFNQLVESGAASFQLQSSPARVQDSLRRFFDSRSHD